MKFCTCKQSWSLESQGVWRSDTFEMNVYSFRGVCMSVRHTNIIEADSVYVCLMAGSNIWNAVGFGFVTQGIPSPKLCIICNDILYAVLGL